MRRCLTLAAGMRAFGWRFAAGVTALAAGRASADERLFTFSYQTTTVPKGAVEFENWVTAKLGTPEDSTFKRVEFRHELEYGLTDNVQLDFYLADWSWTDAGRGSGGDFDFDDVAATVKVKWLDPTVDPVGIGTYHEIKIGPELFELENKLLVQLNVNRWMFAYNLTLEAEWEGHGYEEDNGEISNSLGASYEMDPRFFVGAELLHEIPLPDWHTGGAQTLYVGPNASWRFADNWFLTGTVLRQLTDVDDEAVWQARFILGVEF